MGAQWVLWIYFEIFRQWRCVDHSGVASPAGCDSLGLASPIRTDAAYWYATAGVKQRSIYHNGWDKTIYLSRQTWQNDISITTGVIELSIYHNGLHRGIYLNGNGSDRTICPSQRTSQDYLSQRIRLNDLVLRMWHHDLYSTTNATRRSIYHNGRDITIYLNGCDITIYLSITADATSRSISTDVT